MKRYKNNQVNIYVYEKCQGNRSLGTLITEMSIFLLLYFEIIWFFLFSDMSHGSNLSGRPTSNTKWDLSSITEVMVSRSAARLKFSFDYF